MEDFSFPVADEGVPGVLKAFRVLVGETRRQYIAIRDLQRDVQEHSRYQEGVERLLRGDEAGRNSLIFQVAYMERMQAEQQKLLLEIKALVEKQQAADTSGRWAIAEKIALGLIGAVTAIAASMITGLLKH